VPEEFAAAYRAAYERALAAQSDEPDLGQHADAGLDEGGLPRRRSPLRVGTHRNPPDRDPGTERAVDRDDRVEDPGSTRFERIVDSGWFVPILLVVLGLLLVLGAYTIGRAFSERVESDSGADSLPQVSGVSSPAAW
jgi:hypothetical protein